MRVLTKITITLLTAITILNAEAQSKITTQDYEVTNDVIKIEENTFKETTTKNISKHNLQTKLTIEFSKGLIKSSKSEYSNQIVNFTYQHTKPYQEHIRTNTSSQDKITLKLLTFNNLNWYFPATNFSISKKIPNQLLELSYKTKTHSPYHKLEVKKNGLTEDYMTTGYGPVVYTYNAEGLRVKEFFPGLFGYNLVYDSNRLLKEKTKFNSAFSKEKIHYFYKKDKRGNWIQKLAIKSDTDSSKKLTFTSRKLTYGNGPVSGDTSYDETFIKWELIQYLQDFEDNSVAKTGCVSGNCNNGFGTFIWKGNIKYTGTFKNSLLNGNGTYTWANGNKYIGNFVDDKRTGYGKQYTKDKKLVYEGNLLNNYPSGKGILYLVSGDKYEGEFKFGDRTGLGTYIWTNGNKYIGNWLNNKRDGKGTYYDFKNNKKYERIYKNGTIVQTINTTNITKNIIPNGIVWKRSEDSKKYWLYVNKKLMNNEGVTFWIDNHLYVYLTGLKEVYFLENFKLLAANIFHKGELLRFKPQNGIWYKPKGDAVIVYNAKGKRLKDADIYKYNSNKVDVLFKGINESQTLLFKNFKNATINKVYPAEIYNTIKTTTTNNSNLTKKTGCIKGDCKNGKGTYAWINGDSYEGDYINGNITGQGIYIWGGNGDKYIGGFINGKQNGKGTFYNYEKGIKYIQIYKDGKATETISKTNILINNSVSANNHSDFQTKINSCKQQTNPYNCIYKKTVENYNFLKKSGMPNASIIQTTVNNLNGIGRYDIEILFKILMNQKNPITKEDLNKIMPKLDDNIKTKIKKRAQKVVNDYSKTHNMN